MKYHMRREDKAITKTSEMWDVLEKVRHVTLAMTANNEPYLVTLSHAVNPEKNEIYFHCSPEGKKMDILASNPKVWGQGLLDLGYEVGECNHYFTTVMFSGDVSFVEDESEKWDVLALMTRKLVENPERLIEARNRDMVLRTRVCKISVNYMSGKKSLD